MTHVAQFGLQFHRCGHTLRVTLAESRVFFFCVGVRSGRGSGSGSGMQVAQGGCRCKPCWLREGAQGVFVSNGIDTRIMRPSRRPPSVEKWSSVGEAWTPASSRHKLKVSTAHPPHAPSISSFKLTRARCADQTIDQIWCTCVSAI